MNAHVEVNCGPGTVGIFRRLVELYILPALGGLPVSAVDRSHVSDPHFRMRDKPYLANQTVSLLAKMFKLAEAWGMTPPRRNPCRASSNSPTASPIRERVDDIQPRMPLPASLSSRTTVSMDLQAARPEISFSLSPGMSEPVVFATTVAANVVRRHRRRFWFG